MLKRLRDAEETFKKKKQLKLLFKKVVRQVIINTQWLDDNEDEQRSHPFSSSAKRNLSLLVRTKRKSELLTAKDKSLIRTPHYFRTISDRKKLCTLFAGLKCFQSIPPKLRARLVPFLQLMSINAGRMVIREGDVPHTVIFVVTGEIEMSKTKLIKISNKLVSEGKIMFGPGDCIGDLEMTEECNRIHTFITRSQCELLALFEDDFDSILRPYMKKIWIEKKKALKALDYFNFLDEEQILNACKMSSLRQFKPLDTIYSHDKGTLTNVHFVLSGECVVLQCLNVKVKHRNGKKVYELVDTLDEANISEDSDNDSKNKDSQSTLHLSSDDDNEPDKKRFKKMKLKDIELACAMGKDSSIHRHQTYRNKGSSSRYSAHEDVEEEELSFYEEEFKETSSSSIYSFNNIKKLSVQESSLHSLIETEDSEESNESEIVKEKSVCRFAPTVIDETYESHFIDVGSLTFGGIFGLGEKTHHRVIMARDTVQCLMLPRFFLLDPNLNPGNIWQRRLFYLNCIIPTREMLFNDFLRNLKWKKFKSDYLNENLKSIANDIATIDDIPILCRIEEGIENY
ncbi:uncharacterized protein LOC117790733 [Drosophila innubila]|uniref:uncharacterized protein LOC117790733 n=1 Tax=Drosophila innubila TaxID=198719 RepID=UPI00148BFF8A|nr:uncharacterized protein LOC117790733 [Drosophila innubila]